MFRRPLPLLALLAAALFVGWIVQLRLAQLGGGGAGESGAAGPVPVEVAAIERGTITRRQTFSGTLEAGAEFDVSPKVSGRLERLAVDLGDRVARGSVVAWVDDAEFVQAVAQADAELAVARANLAEARSALELSARALARALTLREQGVSSEAQYDAAQAEEVARRARVDVNLAQVSRAEAALETARIRLGTCSVVADWREEVPAPENAIPPTSTTTRVVAERRVDEGGLVSANTPILTIVQLDPLVAVVYVPERDYGLLAVGLDVTLVTDAYPGETFVGHVERIAPIFRRATRQVRVEIRVENPAERLKPGMFVRATLELERREDATLVPSLAPTERGGEVGVFVLDGARETVSWRPVTLGIQEGDRVEVRGEELVGEVVVLGQEFCDEGSRVVVPGGVQDDER